MSNSENPSPASHRQPVPRSSKAGGPAATHTTTVAPAVSSAAAAAGAGVTSRSNSPSSGSSNGPAHTAMGASIDEHKPFLAYGGSAAGRRPGVNGGGGGGLQAWVRRRWPVLLAASLGGLYLLREVMGPADGAASSDAGSARLSAGARVQGGKVLLSDVVGAAIHLSELAAREIMDVKLAGTEEMHVKGKTDEGVDEPVTMADARSNRIFVNGLRALFPGLDILSEETDPDPLDLGLSSVQSVELAQDPWLDLKDVLITVDPLDATKEFTENLLQYVTTMVCVVHKGRPVAGVINEVFAKDEAAVWGVTLGDDEDGFKAVHGVQATGADPEAAEASVVVSRSHTGKGADVVTERLPGKTPVFAGGSGYKALRVLKGEADAYVHVTKIKSWDVCAADAVVHAAGGRFTDLRGARLRYVKADPLLKGGIIAAAHPEDHEWYVEQLEGVEV